MKNKEIEELLNELSKSKEIYYDNYDYIKLNCKEQQLLSSYIEQLENLCNKYEQEHKTTFEIWKKDIKKLEQLENNRDKAIEYIEEKGRLKYNPNELIKLLKGDSE